MQFKSNAYWVSCQNQIQNCSNQVIESQYNIALHNRLDRKGKLILKDIQLYNGDRKYVLFKLLFNAFGTKVNQKPFIELFKRVDNAI